MRKGNKSRPRILFVSKRDAGIPLVRQGDTIHWVYAIQVFLNLVPFMR